MRQFLALAAAVVLAVTLSACTIYQSPSGGRYTLAPGYDYSHESDQGDPVIGPNGLLRPF